MAHAGGVDDAGHAVEAGLVEVRDGQVEGLLVEQFGELVLVELGVDLAPAQRHLGDRAHAHAGGDAHAAQRRDDPAPRGLGEVEARGLGREQVGDVAGDQRARGGHADEDRPGPVADRGARLLAQRGVGLVADDDRVGARDLAGVAHEPLVGLDRHGALGRVLALQQRAADALRVAAVAQLAVELVDEVAPVGEDQHPARLGGLDEAERRDRLAGAGGVLEPEALGRVGVLGLLGERVVLVLAPRPSRGAPPRTLPRLLLGSSSSSSSRARRAARPRSSSSSSSSSGAARWTGPRSSSSSSLVLLVLLLVLLVLLVLAGASAAAGSAPAPAVARLVGAEDVGRGQQLGRGRRGGAAVAAGDRCAAPRRAAP